MKNSFSQRSGTQKNQGAKILGLDFRCHITAQPDLLLGCCDAEIPKLSR